MANSPLISSNVIAKYQALSYRLVAKESIVVGALIMFLVSPNSISRYPNNVLSATTAPAYPKKEKLKVDPSPE